MGDGTMMTTKTTYRIEYRDGFAANSHFGREIASRIASSHPQDFATLAEARAALRRHRTEHGGERPGRFDIVASDGRRWSWE